MAENDAGVTTTDGQAPAGEAPVEGTPAPATGNQPDEITKLRSRTQGLDAKVTSLTQSQAAEKTRADAAEAKLQEYIGGKAVEDTDTRALLQRLSMELDASKQAAKVAGIAAKYPETYGVIGDGVGAMSEDQLAAAEARFRGVPDESNRPPTVGNNVTRPSTGVKTIQEMSLAELKDYAQAQFKDTKWEDITQSG